MCHCLKIRGQLPAPIVNGGENFWKRPDFQLWRARDLDLVSGHTAYRRASRVDLYLHAKFHWNERNFLWTDGRTYVRTYGRIFETGFIRSTLSKSQPKSYTTNLSHDIYFSIFLVLPVDDIGKIHVLTILHWTKCHLYRMALDQKYFYTLQLNFTSVNVELCLYISTVPLTSFRIFKCERYVAKNVYNI